MPNDHRNESLGKRIKRAISPGKASRHLGGGAGKAAKDIAAMKRKRKKLLDSL